MAVIKLGYVPNRGDLVLSEGADFVCSLQEVDNGTPVVWPDGTTCRMEFPELTGIGPFNATVSEETGTASFVLDKTVTVGEDILDKTPFHIYLVKENEFLWFQGKVDRQENGHA